MGYKLETTKCVRSPVQKLAVKATLTGQTDDDWYKLEVIPLDEKGRLTKPAYPLKASHLRQNIGDMGFSRNGLIFVALEYNGKAIVWQQGKTGRFDTAGQILSVGSPIYGLEISDSGKSFSLQVHLRGQRTYSLLGKRWVETSSLAMASVA